MEKKKRGRPRKNLANPTKSKKVSRVEIEVTDGEVTKVKKVKTPKVIAPVLNSEPKSQPKSKTVSPKRTSDGGVVIEAQKDDSPKTGGKSVVFRGGKPVLVDDTENPDID